MLEIAERKVDITGTKVVKICNKTFYSYECEEESDKVHCRTSKEIQKDIMKILVCHF